MTALLTVVLTVLKLLSTLMSAVFGIMALLVKYKDESGKITRWGRIALIGVVTSASVSAATLGIEYWRGELSSRAAAAQTLDQLRRSEAVLKQLERTLHPLEAPEVTAILDLPLDLQGFSAFAKRLKDLGERLRKDPGLTRGNNRDFFVTRSLGRGNGPMVPAVFYITPESKYFPSKADEPELFALLAHTEIIVSIVANSDTVAAARIRAIFDRTCSIFKCKIEDYSFAMGDNPRINYEIDSGQISIELTEQTEARDISKTGAIISIPDFDASFALVGVSNLVWPDPDRGPYPFLRAAREGMRLRYLSIRTSGRVYYFRKDAIQSFNTRNGWPISFFGSMGDGWPIFYLGPLGNGREGK